MTRAQSESDAESGSAEAIPDLIDGRYRVVRLLGEDRLGRTFEVRDQQEENQRVALKLYWPKLGSTEEFKELLSRSAGVARNILGDHIGRVRNAGASESGSHYLTMDMVRGEPLRERMTREGVFQPRHALEITRQLLEALTVGHDKNVIHDEVTPSNVMLSFGAEKTRRNPYGIDVQLLNFGLADLGEVESAERPNTLYLSPERAEGKHSDTRSDIFSVGIICCEMFLGRKEFQSGLGNNVRQAAAAGDAEKLQELLRDLPPGLWDLISRALSKDRENRYASASKFREAVESCAAYQETTQTPLSVEIAIVVLFLFGIAAAWFAWSQFETARESAGLLSRRTEELNKSVEDLKNAEKVLAARVASELTARAFDNFLVLVEERRPVDAFVILSGAELEETTIPGAKFLTTLERIASILHDAKEIPDLGVRRFLVERAKSLYAEVESLRKTFPDEAEGWLSQQIDGDKDPKRVEKLDGVLATLKVRLRELEAETPETPTSVASAGGDVAPEAPEPTPAELEKVFWANAIEAGPDEDPSAAFETASKSEDDPNWQLMEFLGKYRDGLRDRVLQEGKLNQEALSKESQLLTWTSLLEETPATQEWPAAREVRLFGYARRFYHEGDVGPFPLSEVFSGSSTSDDWREELSLRVALLQGQPYALQSPDHLNVYVRRTEDVRTFLLSRLQKGASDTSCVISYSVLDEAGDQIAASELEISRSGVQYSWDETQIDLAQGPARIEVLEPAPEEQAVPRRASVRPEDVKAFRAEISQLASEARRCLVFETADGTLWLSPRYGLMRAIEGTSTQNLIFSKAQP